jgi:alpha-tubulin suppressor-like RCC1 family protein
VTALANVAVLSAGNSHMMAMGLDGGVSVWGNNQSGQLGDGTRVNRSAPVLVAAHNGSAVLAGGYGFSLGLKLDGTVWSWGVNNYGRLGNSTAFYQLTPAQVSIPN